MTDIKNILKRALKSTLNEKIEDKANKLIEKIQKMEMYEMYDDSSLEDSDLKSPKDIMSKFFKSGMERKRDIKIRDPKFGGSKFHKSKETHDDEKGTELAESEMCECGSGMYESECNECGKMYEGIYDVAKNLSKNKFDYIEEDEDIEGVDKIASTPQACIGATKDANEGGDRDFANRECKSACNAKKSEEYEQLTDEEKLEFKSNCEKIKQLSESKKLVGNQKKLDRNKNNRIDAEDFKLLRKSKKTSKKDVDEEEMEEGNAFTYGLSKTKKGGSFKLGNKTIKDTSDYDVKESVIYHITDSYGDIIKLTENEMVDLIENIITEQKIKGLKTIGKPKGLTTYEKAHKGSGKENDDYIKSVTKKMKDYLKDGSKGKFEMNPKMFPQGNGELGKMNKKAYQMTDELEDFNYEIAGQNFPGSDGVQYNEDWMEKLFKGDSMTGNAPGGNALPSKTNDRFNKMRKKNTLKKLKDLSYKRVPQPVFNEKSGTENGKGLNIKLEATETKKVEKLNEEFGRIQELLGYNRKTQ